MPTKGVNRAIAAIIDATDANVRELSNQEYKEVLEDLIDNFKMRLESVEEHVAGNEE